MRELRKSDGRLERSGGDGDMRGQRGGDELRMMVMRKGHGRRRMRKKRSGRGGGMVGVGKIMSTARVVRGQGHGWIEQRWLLLKLRSGRSG